MNYPAASSGVSKFHRFGESQAQQAAGNMTPRDLREAWAKRRYEAHFVSKLTDCDGENSETDSSLDFARDCGFITMEEHRDLVAKLQKVGRMLGSMIKNPDPFLRLER